MSRIGPDTEADIIPNDYKRTRIIEMAEILAGEHLLKKHTVKLISMLLTEDGTLTAERRHDCIKGVCYAIGIQGHHICHRGTPLVSQDHGMPMKKYCSWKDGKSPQEQFESDFPVFSTSWRVQFAEYEKRMLFCLSSNTINSCIQSWNPREAGRIAKVTRNEHYVMDALGY